MTDVERDADGAVVRLITRMAEPEWDPHTRALVLALDEWETHEKCSLCGRPKSVCQNPANEFSFGAPDPARCHATTALLAKQKGYTEQTNPHLAALLWSTYLRSGEGVSDGSG